MPTTLTENIQTFIQERYQDKLETLNKEFEKSKNQTTDQKQLDLLQQTHTEKLAKLNHQYKIPNWIDSAATRANQISMASHAVKFIHSSAKGTNLIDQKLGTSAHYLDTQSLENITFDAVGNAAALDVARFLQLTDQNNKSLLSYLEQNDLSPLAPLATSPAQLEEWHNGLSQALTTSNPSSHTLGKQIYFPIAENQYHLLIPLYSSSLSQEIYNEIQYCRYSQEMKQIRDARKNKQFCEDTLVSYPNLAITVAGGSKPQNVSQLNSKRGGITYLFRAAPPQWQDVVKPPLNTENIFNHSKINMAARNSVWAIVQHLTKLNEKETPSSMVIRDTTKEMVQEVIDNVLNQTGLWQELPAGWSESSELPDHQRYWLDPNNFNPEEIYKDDWIQAVSQDFGSWLVYQINTKAKNKFTLGKINSDDWGGDFKDVLREWV
ncbi:type I-F CRISPR-associated protein Csy1 [Mergibacter septicus]|uniref:type I-F CRISPR-associated protein Csy1 n=1 Tax=Mergibacter septicus TaxID=221402 RepID=UPI001C785D08|nr:type I-F CRISPR-associated protein Csy1 [Mergibacter septicus]QDJ13788.1 type I-F CRISPR-associated protein Csy1 [Mergibacter septicus]